MTSRGDIPHIVTLLRDTATLLEQRGDHAWHQTRQWQPGPTAATLTPNSHSGNIPDPTGTAATTREPDPHIQLVNRLTSTRNACIDLTDTLHRVGPAPTTRWCWYFAQIGVKEPAPTRSIDGRPASEWAYRRWLNTGQAPTLEQLRRRAEGRRNRGAA